MKYTIGRSDGVQLPFQRIVTGGQTGVDRAALDWAIANDIPHGGWCPSGRVAEDGPIGLQYALTETSTSSYPERTRMNVRDSDATLILYLHRMGAGTALTQRICRELNAPLLAVKLDRPNAISKTAEWIRSVSPTVLNIAGPRESGTPGGYELTRSFLDRLANHIRGATGELFQ